MFGLYDVFCSFIRTSGGFIEFFLLNLPTGILSSLGNASTGFDIWKSFDARHSRNSCRTFILLPHGASSSC